MNAERVLKALDESIENELALRKEHKGRVGNLINWWNDVVRVSLGENTENQFVTAGIDYNGTYCICTSCALVYPLAEVTIRPYNAIDDAGSGAGNAHTIKF